MRKKLLVSALPVLFFISFVSIAPDVQAQCPMCKASVESNLAKGGTKGAGLNKGILFLLVAPYVAASAIAFMYYKNHKMRKRFLASQSAT
jgi:hypothetical protein